ncbi:hypothetical protein R1sor_009895 [Riccia sorocarpa]|uniref:Thioredoxin domain-containing protein n=1 Tax=Riccia sorocarpa TaxID=122646 RepID=A0ABD3HZT3_9MARC
MLGLRCLNEVPTLGPSTNQVKEIGIPASSLYLPRGGIAKGCSKVKPGSHAFISRRCGPSPRGYKYSTLIRSSFALEIFASSRLRYCRAGKSLVGESEEIKMPGAMIDADFNNFDSVLKAAEVQGAGTLLLLFLANRDSALGKSWCPDCVRAEPVIYKVVDGAEKPVTLVRVYVGDRPTWRNAEHPLRKDPRFTLKGVPTLIKWENGGITGRLEDYEAHVEEKVKKLIS